MALDTKHKETTLSEDAAIYTSHKDIPEKEKWHKMSRSERITHFREYYAVPLLIAACVIGIAAFLITDAVTNYRTIAFMAAVINDDFDDDTLTEFNENFLDYLGYDSGKYKSNVSDGYIISGGTGSDAVSAAESITSYIYAKQLDAMISDTSTFDHYASLGCFLDLSELLTEEQYQKYSDYIYYPNITPSEQNVPGAELDTVRPDVSYPCGIYIGESEVYKKLGGAQPNPVIGLLVTSQHVDDAIKFLEYLFPDA